MRMMETQWDLFVHTDGASRGNPGEAGVGIVFCKPDGEVVHEVADYLGVETNNVAEYKAMLRALDEVVKLNATKIKFFSDSELMVKQINGQYKVKHPNLQPLYQEVKNKLARLEAYTVEHVRREKNHNADRLANQGIDQKNNEMK